MAKNDTGKGDTPTGAKLKAAVARMQRAPKVVAIPVGVSLLLGGTILAPLPLFGVWMALWASLPSSLTQQQINEAEEAPL